MRYSTHNAIPQYPKSKKHPYETLEKPGFVRNQVYYSYNNFTTNENPWMKRHGTAGMLAVPFCYYDMELNKQ